jgi:RHS repeat-associated protein
LEFYRGLGAKKFGVKYNTADGISKDVNFNGDGAFIMGSDSKSVKGDEQGKLGGVVSGTVGAKSEPILSSTSVKVNGKFVIRNGDLHKMQGGNTIGKLVTKESGATSTIKDNGAIEGDTLPPDLDLEGAKRPMPSLSGASSTKPTASSSSGGLGSRTGSPVLLQTAQLIYTHKEIDLWGRMPLKLEHTYLSRDNFTGIFGKHRRFAYEQSFLINDANSYRLSLADGRRFDFGCVDNSYEDLGKLGVTITKLGDDDFILSYDDARVETYHKGRLLSSEDANGNTISLVYKEDTKIQRVVNSDGSYFEFDYNEQGLVSKIMDFAKRQWTLNYDTHHNLISSTNPLQATTSFSYEVYEQSDGILSSLLTQIKDAQGNTTLKVSYTDDAKVKSYKDKELSYTYTYLNARMIAKEDQEGNIINYALDDNGLIDAITFQDGTTSKEDYDEASKTASITDQGGNTTLKQFDEKNRLIKEIDQSDNETILSYEGKNPNPVSITSNEQTTSFTYDKRYNLTAVQYPDGKTQSFEYDKKGNTTKIIDAMGNETLIEYDNNSHPISITDALGAVTTFTYNISGQLNSTTDAKGNTTKNIYDTLDNLLSTTEANGNTTSFTYDKSENLLSITDPMNNTTHFTYDMYARVIKQTREDGKVKEFQYNTDGTLKSLRYEDGQETLYTYNKAKKPIEIINGTLISRYTYDSLGNLLSASDENSEVTYSYNSHAQIITDSQNGIDIDKRWDTDNKALQALSFLDKSFSYTREEDGNIKSIKTAFDTIELSYDDNGIIQERNYPNKESETLSYDTSYNLTQIQTAKEELNYSYDVLGQVESKNDKLFIYDASRRLSQSPRESFMYDKAGNNLNNKSQYHPNNYQLQENETDVFTYDARGNLCTKLNKHTQEKTYYTYNARNQLVKVECKDYAHRTINVLSFTYDALNRRISKTINQTSYHYLYENANIVAILDDEKTMIASIIHSDEIDTPLSITTYEKSTLWGDKLSKLTEEEQQLHELSLQNTYYYHRDHQGSIIALTDKDANIVESFIYDESYGKILEHNKEVQTHNPYAYTGRELDQEDLYYYRARYYDPQIGRFLSQDPIEYLSGDFNFYRYVENSPTNYTDPFGFQKKGCLKYAKRLQKYEKQVIKKLEKKVAKLGLKSAAKGVFAAITVEIPFIDIFTIAMAADSVNDLRHVEEELSKAMDNYNILDLAEKACKKREKKRASAQKSGKNGAKVKRKKKLKKKKVKCFCPGDHDKGGRDEYDRQLKNQQDGINGMSADDYIKKRQAYKKSSKDICNDGDVTDETRERDGKVTADARQDRINQQTEKYSEELENKHKNGENIFKKSERDRLDKLSGDEKKDAIEDKIESLATKKATNEVDGTRVEGYLKKDGSIKPYDKAQMIGGQDALHNQDMIVGGEDMIGDTPGLMEFDDKDFGTSDVNRGIGRQWSSRAKDIDEQACAARKNGEGDKKLDVELRACGKKEAKKMNCPKKRSKTHVKNA